MSSEQWVGLYQSNIFVINTVMAARVLGVWHATFPWLSHHDFRSLATCHSLVEACLHAVLCFSKYFSFRMLVVYSWLLALFRKWLWGSGPYRLKNSWRHGIFRSIRSTDESMSDPRPMFTRFLSLKVWWTTVKPFTIKQNQMNSRCPPFPCNFDYGLGGIYWITRWQMAGDIWKFDQK